MEKELLEIQYSIYNGELMSYRETPSRKIIFKNDEELNDFRIVEEMLTQRMNPTCNVIIRLVTTDVIQPSAPIEKTEDVNVNALIQWRKPKFMKLKLKECYG